MSSLGAIILVDLALSGDNALIIGAAAAGLERQQRRLAIVLGGGAAIVLRIAFAVGATLLLLLPLLEAIGGAVLLVIAARLLMGRDEHRPDGAEAEGAGLSERKRTTLRSAMLTILVADVTMSLDNVLAIGGLAHGDLVVLTVGLVVSVALLLVGSAVVAELIGRLPWLLDLAAIVLGWTAGTMIFHDKIINPYLHALPYGDLVLGALGALIVLAIDLFLRWRERRRIPSAPLTPTDTGADEVNARG